MTKAIATNDLAQLAKVINREHDLACQAIRTGLEHALTAGDLLQQAKAKVQHGDWLAWLEANCTVSERTAQAYMRLAREWPRLSDPKAQRVADLPLRQVLALVAEPRSEEAPQSARAEIPENPYWRFLAVAESLIETRERQLYRDTHPDFRSYLCDHWQITPDEAAKTEERADDPALRAKAYTFGQIWNLVPGIKLTLTGIEPGTIPENLSFEKWKKVLDLFAFLAGSPEALKAEGRKFMRLD